LTLRELKVDDDRLRQSLNLPDPCYGCGLETHLPFTRDSRDILQDAVQTARDLGHDYVGSEHLLIGVAMHPTNQARLALDAHGASLAAIQPVVLRLLAEPWDAQPKN
jgi:ATP-dependent Clp protease ATP-binding subunit ClpC